MIAESGPWKIELKKNREKIIKYNNAKRFQKDDEKTYTIIEKSIFYSAFIIRKLIDCGGKLSDEADGYIIKVKSIKPLKQINIMNRWSEDDSHDWTKEKAISVKGKNICNYLIHSYIFFVEFNSDGKIGSFCVSSDFNKNRYLYRINLDKWMEYMKYIETDNIASLSASFDEKSKEYIYIRKERGIE